MPTYDLICRSCGHRYEKFVMRVLRTGEATCPRCGSVEVSRGVGGGVVVSSSKRSEAGEACSGGRFT